MNYAKKFHANGLMSWLFAAGKIGWGDLLSFPYYVFFASYNFSGFAIYHYSLIFCFFWRHS
ncbi:MAG: hypothetical protein A2293_05100 [Elusimicrobia bacterium RIFOXYB2_FULL_49_7]|nr:MAG: hypothetical protein A2293_05100 [Elusimicrobia bacterium RIFOXYB2_FULL_49_7]